MSLALSAFFFLLKVKHASATRKFVPQPKPEVQPKTDNTRYMFFFLKKIFSLSVLVSSAFYIIKAALKFTRQS